MSVYKYFSRPRLHAFRVGCLATVASAGLAFAGAAHADTPADPSPVLTQYSIPSKAPSFVPGGGEIPQAPGALGNASELFVGGGYENTSQVITVQNGSKNWGTPAVTSQSADSGSQQWYLQRVGYVDDPNTPIFDLDSGDQINFGDDTVLERVPIYKLINYNGSSHTCLDAYGGGGADGTEVDSYGCDPNSPNQANQLWVIASYPGNEIVSPEGGQISALAYPQYSPLLQRFASGGGVIENVASLEANDWDTTQAPVLSAPVNYHGINSPLQLASQTGAGTFMTNSTFSVVDAYQGGTQASNGPSCSKLECLIDLGS